VAVYDKDHQINKLQKDINSANESTSRIKNLIDSSIGSAIEFENDIEEEIGFSSSKSKKPHVALEKVSSLLYQIPEQLKQKIISMYS
jgi:CRISPR-associated exonuclease Cas4